MSWRRLLCFTGPMKLLLTLLAAPLLAATLTIDSGSPSDQFFVGGKDDFTISYPGVSGDLSVRYGAFSYHIPRDPGVYLVTLNFRETGTVSAKAQRIFSVKLNGQLVLDRFDLFASAPGLMPIERGYVTTSNNGFIDIDFSYSLKSALVSSITIQQLFFAADAPQTRTLPEVTAWSSCKSGLVLAGPAGPGVPSPTAAWPGLRLTAQDEFGSPVIKNTAGEMIGWSCDGLQAYTFKLPNGSTDGPYVAVRMPDDFVMDSAIWKKQ